eukprot:jgi/Ulvmu1/1127/UM106_0044.1
MSAATRRCANALRGSFGGWSHGVQPSFSRLQCASEDQFIPAMSRLYRILLSRQGQQVTNAPRAHLAVRSWTTSASISSTSSS